MEKIDTKFLLAPMAGYSDVGFRQVCSDCGADLCFSEMLSSQAMKYDSAKTKDMAVRGENEKHVFAQIFGKDAAVMAEAVKNPLLEKFDGIDINMGCPAPKVVKNGEGSALLKDLPNAAKIIAECRKATSKPLSVKVRIGFDSPNVAEIAKICQENGADFITVHGRTTKQMFSGRVDYDSIALAKQSVKIPVFGNGDVTDEASCRRMLQTGVDGVMIGRGAVGSPWIFSQLKFASKADEWKCICSHVEILRKYYADKWLTLYLRKHFLSYAAKLGMPTRLKQNFALMTNIDESLKIFQRFINHFEM